MDIPLQFHEFRHLNHGDRCPKYTEILQKSDSVNLTDLDALYTDLETLQGASNIRLRRLEDEIKILTEWCDKKDRSKGEASDLDFLSSVNTLKRSRQGNNGDEPRLSKKQKTEESVKAGSSKKRSKGKAAGENYDTDISVTKPKHVYDAPNKFWGYVEPYCADISPEDIAVLEDSLTSKVDVSEYFKITPLGKHYSEVWAKEDFIEEQQQSSKIDKKRSTPVSNANENAESKFSKIDASTNSVETDEQCPYGTFTQRLVAALVDENIMAPMTGNEMQDIKLDEKLPTRSEQKLVSKKNTMVANSKNLEAAIKEELFSLGLIDSTQDEETDYDADDEILAELRKCQSELKALRSHNKHSINKLLARAKGAMKKQELKQKAKIADTELVDIFRRFSSTKAKKKGTSRKDRELAWKLLRERDAIWKMVDSNETEKSSETNEKS